MAVLLYHADLAWIPGGFLGVEVFFVISGYLITALLLSEWRQKGGIDLKNFWLRRARRLLPALYVLLVVTLAFAVVFLPGEVAGLRGDVLAAFGYVTNWYLIFGQESYFEAVGRPSVLQHLWSLAVEEQFYLIWPIFLAVGLAIGATHLRRRRVLTLTLAGAASSAVAMALLYAPGVDPSRIYYGADTRATGLLCGAALAFLWSPGEKYRPAAARHRRLVPRNRGWFRRRWGWTAPLVLDVVGVGALGP
jgi:peptidoglycan/LPS O-acetylase OafA/YrhL